MRPALEDLSELIAPFEGREDLAVEMEAIYADLDREISRRGPTCWNHGDCCKFGAYGHRLYVSGVELTFFRQGKKDDWRIPHDDGCPYQAGGQCTARWHRPLGCRVFFCDPSAQGWQGPLYEEFLLKIKAAGDRLGLEYRYVEWLSALATWSGSQCAGPVGASVDARPAGVIELTVLHATARPAVQTRTPG